jgi:hypothetical protein
MKRTIGYARYINYKGSADFLTKKSLQALEVKKEKADRLDENLEQYLDIIFDKPVSL